ncbi:GntR family transcriptional regulator [Paenibacillus graminis]|uniref:GntR family transcriptional regulator n=1 Tax=Paenibacillus graminis TaxID=189425 RepID=UPI002DBCFE4E|nr:GntR family transcriptional regulator [Paenibacillus graminis]
MLLVPNLSDTGGVPYYIQLYDYFKKEIISGSLPMGTRLPSIRIMAAQLQLSTTPVELAYQQLLSEGFIVSKPRSGYYVSPSHQFPREMVMPIAKRVALLEWARGNSGYIIEDDYDGEFRYHGCPIPALQGLLEDSPVIYMCSFAQSLAPALCIHYMVLPKSLVPDYHRLKASYTWSIPLPV